MDYKITKKVFHSWKKIVYIKKHPINHHNKPPTTNNIIH